MGIIPNHNHTWVLADYDDYGYPPRGIWVCMCGANKTVDYEEDE